MDLIKKIEKLLIEHLKPYLLTLHDYVAISGDNLLEINCKKYKDDPTYFILIRMGINKYNHEVYIYNIFVPNQDRKMGIGLGLIAFTYEIAKTINFALVLADMTKGFKDAMLKRGAITTNVEDCLQVTDGTYLK